MRADLVDELNTSVEVELTSTSATVLDGLATGTIEDDDPTPPNVRAEDAPTVFEGDPGTRPALLTFRVQMSPAQKAPVSVRYVALPRRRDVELPGQLVAGPEDGGSCSVPGLLPLGRDPAAADDFLPTSGDLVIPVGATGASIAVPLVGDLRNEPEERVEVSLSDLRASGALGKVIGDSGGKGFIGNDDPLPARWRVADASAAEGSPKSPGVLRFRVSITPAQKTPVGASFVATGGTAVAGSDFSPTRTRVVLPAGATEAFVEVPVLSDLDVESDERLSARLEMSDGPIEDGNATGTIVNDDLPPGVSISDAIAPEGTASDGVFDLRRLPRVSRVDRGVGGLQHPARHHRWNVQGHRRTSPGSVGTWCSHRGRPNDW